MVPVIEVTELTKFYGDREILHALNFIVSSQRICGFLGPNGSGKSTTMDILAGLLGPSTGHATVCGYDVVTQAKDVKACIGYLPDNPPLHKEMMVHDFIDYVARLRGVKSPERKAAVADIMEECDVGAVAKRLIGNLSKGYRQRVSLCAALVHKPPVLLLDEPTEGLDPNQILHIRNLIKKLANERTVLMSSHILSEVQATCHDVIIINHGRIAAKMALDAADNQVSYVYSFAANTEGLLPFFQQHKFVLEAKRSPQQENTISVTFKKDSANPHYVNEMLAQFTQDLVTKQCPPIGIQEKKDGLEEIFFEVIRSQPDAVV